MAGCIDTEIYQTIIATHRVTRVAVEAELLANYLNIWSDCAHRLGSSSFLCPVSIYGSLSADCCSSRHRPQCSVLSSVRPSQSSHRPRLSLVTSHSPGSRCHCPGHVTCWPIIIITTIHWRIRHSTGLILAGIAEGSNFAGLTKKVSYERDDRAWDSQTIRTISYHLSWRPPPTLTLTHLILDHSQRSAQFIFYSSSKQAASVRIMLSA